MAALAVSVVDRQMGLVALAVGVALEVVVHFLPDWLFRVPKTQ